MSGHLIKLAPRARRSSNVTISAVSVGAAAVLALVVTGCSSGATTTSAARSPSPVATGPALAITGAGSTFDAPFFDLAFAKYHQRHPGVTVSYSAVGSSAGVAAFTARQVDFGASDVPLTAAEQAAARGGPSVQVPVDLGAEVVVYHPGLLAGSGTLRLTGPVIARIFLGKITRWNDPAITALNPGTHIPREPITVVHRSDGSGTTYIFSNYLSAVDKAWASRVGTGRILRWPIGVGAEGNPGVAAAVAQIPFSIGYVETAYSNHGSLLPYAAIRNQAGRYTTPTNAAIIAAAAQKPSITPANFSIVNEPGANSYPICGYSWALLYRHQTSLATGRALVSLLDWLTHQGQIYAAAQSYAPLPVGIRDLARSMLQLVTGPGGARLMG